MTCIMTRACSIAVLQPAMPEIQCLEVVQLSGTVKSFAAWCSKLMDSRHTCNVCDAHAMKCKSAVLVSVYLCADEYFYYWHGWDLQYKWIRELYQNTSLVDRQPEAIWRGRVADDDYPERDALRSAHFSSLLHYSLLHYSLPRTNQHSSAQRAICRWQLHC